METPWSSFCVRLYAAGYTTDDLSYCSDDLFLTIVEELDAFDASETAQLFREWRVRILHESESSLHSIGDDDHGEAGNSGSRTSEPLLDGERCSPVGATPLKSAWTTAPTAGSAAPRKRVSGEGITLPACGASERDGEQRAVECYRADGTVSGASRRGSASVRRKSDRAVLHRNTQPAALTRVQEKSTSRRHTQASGPRPGMEETKPPPPGRTPVAKRHGKTLRSSSSRRTRAAGGAATRPAWVERMARRFLDSLNAHSTECTVAPVAVGVDVAETLETCMQRLHHPGGEVRLLWKLCSGATAEKVCGGGALTNADDADSLCPSGIVVYSEEGPPPTHVRGDAELGLLQEGWKLVGFDVALGQQGTLSAGELVTTFTGTMAHCRERLGADGLDSIVVETAPPTWVVFDPHQLIARYVVHLRLRGTGAAAGGGATAATPKTPHRPLGSSPTHPVVAALASSLVDTGGVLGHRCPAHPTHLVEFWSPRDKQLLCSHCLYFNGYSMHNCMLLKEAVREELPRLEPWLVHASAFLGEVEGVGPLIDAAKQEVHDAGELKLRRIADQLDAVQAAVDHLRTHLRTAVLTTTEQSRQALDVAHRNVQDTARVVEGLLARSLEPLQRYRQGTRDPHVLAELLHVAQEAFGEWNPVHFPPYFVFDHRDGVDVTAVSEALRSVQAPAATEPGHVVLPKSVDLNHLRAPADLNAPTGPRSRAPSHSSRPAAQDRHAPLPRTIPSAIPHQHASPTARRDPPHPPKQSTKASPRTPHHHSVFVPFLP